MSGSDRHSKVIAAASLDVISRSFRGIDQGDRPCFRVKSLTSSQSVRAFLDLWKVRGGEPELTGKRVVVSAGTPFPVPDEFQAEPGKSITFYRNHIEGGLVYLETKVESDEQGLKNLFTLKDNNFLDGSFDGEDFSVPRRIIQIAWAEINSSDSAPSVLLTERLVEVLSALHPEHVSISVRKYISFVITALDLAAAKGEALEPDEIDHIVGKSLESLDLFPDPEWREPGSEARILRRLRMNALHAELASSAASDIDAEQLVDKCAVKKFVDESGEEYSASDQSKWRTLCMQYCRTITRDIRRKIPYRIFMQLFAADSVGLPLGDRVFQEIDENDSDRIQEFNALGIQKGLNLRRSEDAQVFLDYEAEESGEPALVELITKQTRRMVEKLARPTNDKFDNPLSKIADVATILLGRSSEKDGLTIEVRLAGQSSANDPTVGLFAFLFGNCLSKLTELSRDNVEGAKLVVSDELMQVVAPPEPKVDDDADRGDDSIEDHIEWPPVEVEFSLINSSGKKIDSEAGFEWLPEEIEHFAFFWLLCSCPGSPLFEPVYLSLPGGEPSAEMTWLDQAASRIASLSRLGSHAFADQVAGDPLIKTAIENGREFLSAVSTQGLTGPLIERYCTDWEALLKTAKNDYVPQAAVNPVIEALLSLTSIGLSDKRFLVTPLHPAKMRWISRYLTSSQELALRSLEGQFPLNERNQKLYLNWFDRLTPHKQPPIAPGRDAALGSPARQVAWFDYCTPLEFARGDGSLDSLCLEEVVRQLTAYMDAHPHKSDGLSLLIVAPYMAELPARLLAAFRKGQWKSLKINIHVVSNRESWEQISDSFEALNSESRMSVGRPLFPPLQLYLHEFDPVQGLGLEGEKLLFDVGVAPNFLKDRVSVQYNTDPPVPMPGAFDPLLDFPTQISGGAGGGFVSVSMRPRDPDAMMSDWSTVAVRNTRGKPVSSSQPENHDFAELRIDFGSAEKVFAELHEKCHWVVTIEEHITREQIERLEGGPDILSVKEGIGSGGLYTLIVSSNSGRKFITDRLTRKIHKICSAAGRQSDDAFQMQLASRIYEETSNISPRLALQAMGISRVTEEILGLSVAKALSDKLLPLIPQKGCVGWVSLDDHVEWFGTSGTTRADLCRFGFEMNNDKLLVDILVVEGKLRQQYDQHGMSQVRETLDLLKSALENNDAEPPLDARLWREQVVSAIESSSPQARQIFGYGDQGSSAGVIPPAIREAFRSGRYTIRSIRGLYSACIYGSDGDREILDEADILLVKSYQQQIVEIVEGEIVPEAVNASGPAIGGDSASAGKSDSDPRSPDEHSSERDRESVPVPLTGQDNVQAPGNAEPFQVQLKPVERGRMAEDKLKGLYQIILDKFGEFSVNVKKPVDLGDCFVEGPASILFRVVPGAGVEPRRIYEKADLLKLALGLASGQEIRFDIGGGFINIDVPKRSEDRYFVTAEKLWERWDKQNGKLCVPLGENRHGEIVSIDFSSSLTPHLLIGGTTGSGKSEALNTILFGLVKYYDPKEIMMFLVDPKGTELQAFEDHTCLGAPIGWDGADAISILEKCVQEMQARLQKFKDKRQRTLPDYNAAVEESERMPWWIVVLDEYADLTAEPAEKKQLESLLQRLAQKARSAGVHVIVATQNPNANVINTTVRSNLPAQLALRVRSGQESRIIMDEGGAEALNGMGDGFLKAGGEVVRVQCAKVEKQSL